VEKWSGRKPSLENLRTFGCMRWAHILDDRRKKLDAKIHACIMMGNSKYSKAYNPFDLIK